MIFHEAGKKTEKAGKPQIRFVGFVDEWEQCKLSEIADKVTEKNVGLQYIETFTNSAEYGIISQRDFFDHDIAKISSLDGYYIVKSEDFVYNPRISTSAPVGPINHNRLGRTGVMSPLYTVFRPHEVDTTYLEHFFKSHYWHSFMNFNGDSGVRADRFSIKDSVFFEMPIPIPHIDEQNNIGIFFEKINHFITLHQSKYDKLTDTKKAMLEKMFPKDGEVVPEIRFKGFSDAWEQRKLGDIVGIYDGVHQTPNYQNSGVMFLSVENIATLKSSKFISEEDFKRDYKVFPQENDILMTRIGDVGTTNVVTDNGLKAYYVSLALLKYKSTDPYFLSNAIQSDYVQKGLANRTLKTAIPMKINKDEIGKVSVMLPLSATEQQQIGTCFRNLDNLITLHQCKLEKLKNLKKAFLEKMFI